MRNVLSPVNLLLGLILIIATIFRLYYLSSVPPLDLDEYGIYYNAFSIATQGIDEWGRHFPLFFESFGDFKLSLDIYLVAALFKIFEPSAFWLRFPSVIFSVLYIPLVFLLTTNLTGKRNWGILGAVLVSLIPYSIFYSHSIGASISASLPIFASITFFILGMKKEKRWTYVLISMLCLVVAIYAYPLAWIIAPLLILAYTYFLWKEKRIRLVMYYAFFVVAAVPILLQFFIGGSQIRLSNTSAIAYDRGPFTETQAFRQTAENDLLSNILHNKATTSGYILVNNYLKHFNISYLGFDKTEPLIQISPYPPLYLVLLPFYVFGIIILIQRRKDPRYLLLLYVLLIAPLPSAITEGAVHPKRYLASLGLESILVVLALQEFKIHKRKLVTALLAIILAVEVFIFVRFFYGEYAAKSDQLFYAKARMIEEKAKVVWPKSQLFYTTESLGEPQIYPLVGAQYSPIRYQQTRNAERRDNWVFVRSFDNLYFEDSIENLIPEMKKVMIYPSYGIFSDSELRQLESHFCFDINGSKNYLLLKKQYLEVTFKECLP